jgi:2-polyprenyl-6-hydroxyphenyl methylase/3-demethylubiquinone-9 3-methyltransferase
MAPLHAMNPLRADWVASRAARAHGPYARVLDVGCGAGLLSEALARCGFLVTGIDASAEAIDVARAHAAAKGLPVEYRAEAAEALLAEGARFPVITALEVIEHVRDPAGFLRLLAGLLAPGGLLFVSTLNRTARSFAVAKLGAEYVLRLLPAGTHDWRRFVTPAELATQGRGAGLLMTDSAGMTYEVLRRRWVESRDLSVNYIAALSAPGQAPG